MPLLMTTLQGGLYIPEADGHLGVFRYAFRTSLKSRVFKHEQALRVFMEPLTLPLEGGESESLFFLPSHPICPLYSLILFVLFLFLFLF